MRTSEAPATRSAEREFRFGPFHFKPLHQSLLRDGEPVRLGGRAMDILAALLERPGELVTKRELIARAWPQTVVDDSNLKVHVAALRRALGDTGAQRRIVTVNGRGYSFVGAVDAGPGAAAEAPAPALPALPALPARPIGRETTVAALAQSLAQRRLLTIVGPGGIGKTTVALATAQALVEQSGLEACFVDLGRVSAGQFVAGTVAAALGLTIHSGDPAQAVVAWLRTRPRLVVLDSCENVIDAAAVMAERIVVDAPGTLLLATSREPLRIAGEHVHQLAPLAYPDGAALPSAAAALAYPAVQLFVERAAEVREGYRLDDADAPAVAEICRRLEGIALAIELAATRIDAFGATELAARLDDRFRLLRRGRRGGLARHRTLEAALDWSYAVLPAYEQALLRGLAVFADLVAMDAAIAVLAQSPDDAAAVVDGIGNLVAKSLLAADVDGARVHYRLLDTTRAYALEKLDERGETATLRGRHAHYLLAGLRAGCGGEGSGQVGIDDLRAALAWAFAPGGDARLGVALTVAAIPLWMCRSLVDECRQAVARALAAGAEGPEAAPDDAMKLYAALAGATLHTRGPVAETGAAWTRALELAEAQDNDEYRLRALWGLAMYRGYVGDFHAVFPLAERLRALALRIGDRAAATSVERLVGTAFHSLGDGPAARHHLELALVRDGAMAEEDQIARFQLDQGVATLSVLGNVLWVLGDPERGRDTMREALRRARASGHRLSLLGALANAACLAVRSFDPEADVLLDELEALLRRDAIAVLDTMRRALRALLDLRRGDDGGFGALRQALAEMRATGFQYRYSLYLATLAAALGERGQRAEALAHADEALAFAEGRGEGWCLPELWRIKGTLLAPVDAPQAAYCFDKALEIAGRQQARLWALRAAVSLAGLRGARERGLARLASLLAGFDEGVESADLEQARRALAGAAHLSRD